MIIEKLELNVVNSGHITNSYLIYDESKKAVLIDPADESNKIISKIESLGLKLEYIILTHAHFDHVNALYDIKKHTGAEVLVHKDDFDMLIGKVDNAQDVFNAKTKYLNQDEITVIDDGYSINTGKLDYEIIHTPGHTAGSIILYEKNNNVIFSGDTMFAKSYGRCDLATGNINDMKKSLYNVFERFNNKDINVYPGHGESSNLNKIKKYIKLLLSINNI